MLKTVSISLLFSAALLIPLVWVSPALSKAKTSILITNGLDVKVSVRFKCYTDKPWETNTCPTTGGQALYIKSKKSFAKAYDHLPGCENIYISFTRYDRSTPLCKVEKKFAFPRGMAKMITIKPTGTGSCDYTMVSINGTIIK